MSRSVLLSFFLLCAGFGVGMLTHNMLPIAKAALQPQEHEMLASIVMAFEQRLSKIERRLDQAVDRDAAVRGLVPLDVIVTNLKSEQMNRFISVSAVLAVEGNQQQVAAAGVAEIEPVLRDWLLSHLADMTVADISGRDNQDQLRKDIQSAANDALQDAGYSGFVTAALLTDVSVQ